MTCDRSLVSVVNALEGYRIRLETPLEDAHRIMFERLMMMTLDASVDYHLPVQPYVRWFVKYQTTKVVEEYKMMKGD
jgi:hypothetical protein